MKQLILIMSLALSINAYSQDDKTVTLIVSGQGQTQDEAKQNALRNAIEEAFGTFISSNTEILNDELVKDEIVSVSNGNIQDFEILSEVQTPDGGYATTLKATVSVTKLTSFTKGKGIEVEFNGSLFAFNVMQQKLNEENELKAIRNACEVAYKISKSSFDYKIEASDPKNEDANGVFEIPLTVTVSKNENFSTVTKIIQSTLQGITLKRDEAQSYIQMGKSFYPVSFADELGNTGYYLLRKEESVLELVKLLFAFRNPLLNFKISNGLTEFTIRDNPHLLTYIRDEGFRNFLTRSCTTRGYTSCIFWEPQSVFMEYNIEYQSRSGVKKGDIRLRGYPLSWIPNIKNMSSKLNFNPSFIGEERVFPDMEELSPENAYYQYYDIYLYISNLTPGLQKRLENYGNSRFLFVTGLGDEYTTGLIVSFMPNTINATAAELESLRKKMIVQFELNDYRTIEELMKISEYKVIPLNN